VGRNPQLTRTAVERIRGEAPTAQVEHLICDLASQEQVRQLVAQIRDRYSKLNVIVNNAGVFTMRRTMTTDGFELQWAVNHLAYYIIAESLADVLIANAPSRIIQVASDSHYHGHVDFDDLSGSQSYSGPRAYAQSKLANVLHTYDLAQRLSATGVTANCLHPGVIRTAIARNNGGVVALAMYIRGLFTPGPAIGARTSIYLATSADVAGTTGAYFANCAAKKSAPLSYDVRLQTQLRQLSAAMTSVPTARQQPPGSV
jgi:NAD(P)-dependent dehydrogenase (short-subunit alcohol dehydrogenase family)